MADFQKELMEISPKFPFECNLNLKRFNYTIQSRPVVKVRDWTGLQTTSSVVIRNIVTCIEQ